MAFTRLRQSNLYVVLEPYCILCRRRLPSAPNHDCEYIGRTDVIQGGCEGWELDVIGVFNTTREPISSYSLHIFRSDLRVDAWPGDYDTRFQLRREYGDRSEGRQDRRDRQWQRLSVALSSGTCRDPEYQPQQALFFIHACCWKLVRRQLPGVSFLALYKLGQQARAILPRNARQQAAEHALSGWPRPEWMAETAPSSSSPAPMRRLVERLATLLPPELQFYILRYLSASGLTAALCRALETAEVLLSRIDSRPTPILTVTTFLPPEVTAADGGLLGTLEASAVSMFSYTYLHRITFVRAGDRPGIKSHRFAIPVQAVPVIGAKAWLGPHGIQAILLVYADHSTSAMLGTPGEPGETTYVYEVYYPERTLQLLVDDLKVNRIGLHLDATKVKRTIEWPGCTMLNADTPMNRHRELYVVDTESHPGQVLHYPDWRLCRRLPLRRVGDGMYATGLTAYGDYRGVCGLVSHFTPQRTEHGQSASCYAVGHLRGLPVHVPLHPAERIVMVAFCTTPERSPPVIDGNEKGSRPVPRARDGLFLIIGTSMGRALLFPSQTNALRIGTRWSSVTRGGNGAQEIIELVVDVQTTELDGHIKSIGVCTADQPVASTVTDATPSCNRTAPNTEVPPQPFLLPLIWPYPLDRHPIAGAVCTAWLSRGTIRRLHVQRIGPRCSGLRIDYVNGFAEVLGCWYPCGLPVDGGVGFTATSAIHADGALTSVTEETLFDLDRLIAAISQPTSLTFRYSEPKSHTCLCETIVRRTRDCRYVADIGLGQTPAGPQDIVFSWASAPAGIAWTYNNTCDLVESWDGTRAKIDGEQQRHWPARPLWLVETDMAD